ncbi:MAG TPA: hypothetical protein VFS76_11155 [Pyrinomonadaceae bacterium]|nr:hypothetical protein [Pyrinomonadaceae bacterium]
MIPFIVLHLIHFFGFFGVLSIFVTFSCQSQAPGPQPQPQNLVLEGTVEKIGVSPGVGSGDLAVYQFAKYRVTSVCEGEYGSQQIVVDHLLLRGNELDRFRPGDRVRLIIKKSNKIFTRNNEDGFRNANDKVEVFYIGEEPKLLPRDCVACEPCG